MIASVLRTIVAGLAGGLAFVLGSSLTFALLGGSRRGQTELLFDPATQSPKVIAVWKEIEPLPPVSVIAWAFWAVCALFEGYTIAFVAEKWGLVASTSSTHS